MSVAPAALDARFDATIRAALDGAVRQPPLPLRLPALVRQTVAHAAPLLPERAEQQATWYTEAQPRALIQQYFAGADAATRALWEPLAPAAWPGLTGALDGMAAALTAAGVDPVAHLGGASASEILARRPRIVDLYLPTVFGSGTSMLAGHPWVLGRRPDERDRYLGAGLAHELAHGLAYPWDGPPTPWMVTEAAAILLAADAWPRHLVPEVAGEAVPGTTLYALVGHVLARLHGGRRALWTLLRGDVTPAQAFGPAAAGVFATFGWQILAHERPVVMYPDGRLALLWSKIVALAATQPLSPQLAHAAAIDPADACAAAAAPDLMRVARDTPWAATAWYAEAPTPADRELLALGLSALFVGYTQGAVVQAGPAAIPDDLVLVDVDDALLRAQVRPDGGAFEPGFWLLPPPYARALAERGIRRVELQGVTLGAHERAADALGALAVGPARGPTVTVDV